MNIFGDNDGDGDESDIIIESGNVSNGDGIAIDNGSNEGGNGNNKDCEDETDGGSANNSSNGINGSDGTTIYIFNIFL